MASEEELVASIKAKMPDFTISVAALKAPTSKFVYSYFVRLLEELGIDIPDCIEQPVLDQACKESMRHMQSLFMLHSILSQFCEQIYVLDFSLDDITEPKPRRTLYLMRALDIYHTFADWKAQNIDMRLEDIYKRKDEMDRLKKIKDEFQQKLNTRRTERAQDDVQIKERQDLAQMKTALLGDIAHLDTEVDRSTVSLNSEKQQLECAKEDFQKLNSECTRLQSQVVSSPARLDKELQELQEKVANSEDEYQQLLQNKKDKCQLKDTYKRNIVLQQKFQSLLKDLLSSREITTKLTSKLENLRATRAVNCQDQKDKTDKLRSKTKKMHEHQEILRLQLEERMAEMSKAIPPLEREVANLRNKRDDEQRQSKEVQAEMQELADKFELLLEVNSKQNKEFQALYDKRIAKQDDFLDKCEAKLKKLMEDMKAIMDGDADEM